MKAAKLPKLRVARPGEILSAEVAVKIPAKYLDMDDVSRIYSITRGRLYPIIKQYPELSITLVEPGRSRGKRLINIQKFEAYLANQPIGFVPKTEGVKESVR